MAENTTKQKGTCNVHNGWMIFDRNNDEEIVGGINKLTGVLQFINGDCFSQTGKIIQFCGWESSVHTKGLEVEDCNDCSMLAAWFSGNTFYTLNTGAGIQFNIKNVDDCKNVIYTKDANTHSFRSGTNNKQTFSNSWVSSGNPNVRHQPTNIQATALTKTDSTKAINYGSEKYPSGYTDDNYRGLHKIKYAFNYSNSITIDSNTITGNTKLIELFIPEKVKKINPNAFSDNSNLTAVTMVDTSEIGAGAFSGCSNLKEINFNYCVNSEYCIYSDSDGNVQKIGDYAFKGCAITFFSAPNFDFDTSSIGIGEGAFSGCTKLRYIEIDDILANNDNFKIGKGAFSDVSGDIGDETLILDWKIRPSKAYEYSGNNDIIFQSSKSMDILLPFINNGDTRITAVTNVMTTIDKNQNCNVYVKTPINPTQANTFLKNLNNWAQGDGRTNTIFHNYNTWQFPERTYTNGAGEFKC